MCWLAIGLHLSTPPLSLAHRSRLPSSARCRTWLTANRSTKRPPDYLEDQAYWTENLPPESGPVLIGCHKPRTSADPNRPFCAGSTGPGAPSPSRRSYPTSGICLDHRSSPRRARCWCAGWCAEGSEVVLDFPVSRRVRPESKTLPGMVAGVVPLVLSVSPESTVADFCEHVDTRIREALQHQRFPVQALERKARVSGPGGSADRVTRQFPPVDFQPWPSAASRHRRHSPILASRATALGCSSPAPVTSSFSARRALGSHSRTLTSPIWRAGLQQVLMAMTADPARRLSSIDLLDGGERAGLDGWGNRAVLTQPTRPSVSIPVHVRRAGGARPGGGGDDRCAGRSWTYRELDEAANRLAHLLTDSGRARDSAWRCCFRGPPRPSWRFWRCSRPGRRICRSTRRMPAARIEFMLADAAPIAAITTAELADRLNGCDLPVIDVDDPRIDSYPCTACQRRRRMTSPTSSTPPGTTGVPKGVAITHHNVTQLIGVAGLAVCAPGRCGRSGIRWPSTSRCGRSGAPCCTAGGWWWCPSRSRAHRKTSTPCWSPNRSVC